jgi:hypothetical protein
VSGVQCAELLSHLEDARVVVGEPVGDEFAAAEARYHVLAAEH